MLLAPMQRKRAEAKFDQIRSLSSSLCLVHHCRSLSAHRDHCDCFSYTLLYLLSTYTFTHLPHKISGGPLFDSFAAPHSSRCVWSSFRRATAAEHGLVELQKLLVTSPRDTEASRTSMFSALTSRTRKLSTSRSFHDKRLSTCTPNAPTDSSGGSPRSTTGFGDDAQAATQASTVANGPHSAQAEMLGGSSSSTSRHLHSSQSRAPAHQQQAEQHPYGHMSSSVRDNEEEEELCPVCLCELSLRLQGERPHVVPVCGHRLREFI